ncbi:DNA-(apurinic or apyrimidinic site) lyase [Orchesella cincta]|uniref:DNA-(apurinic or apyrimidinic site) endonuclease n=1 Tax=Orchesella cincta TaxID=48709 RepID=A0A1D2NHH7_ORCCI|nr:DNA-(apurinic or apyrimidinic site) lyase [Orchesella cincta]
MGRTRKEEGSTDAATRQLDAKSKAIEKAKARAVRETAKKSYKEDSESDSEIEKLIEAPGDKDFSGEEADPSPSESGSDWAGESSGSEYGKKKTPAAKGRGRGKKASVSPKKGKGRGRGRPAAKGKASTPGSRNGSKAKVPAKRRRDDSDESEESEGESSGSEYGKKAATPTKKRVSTARASPAKKKPAASPAKEDAGRRSRGRAASSKSYKEVSEDDFSEEEVVVKPKARAPAKPQPKKAKKESEDEHFSDAVSGSEDEAPKEKEKKNATKPKEDAKGGSDKKTTKNGEEKTKAKKEAKVEKKEEEDEENDKDDESDNESKKSDVSSKSGGSDAKAKGKDADSALKNRTETDYSSINFKCEKKTPSGDDPNFRISSWNIGGIKAFLKKNGLDYIKHESPDVLCLQEIKCNEKTKPEEVQKIDGYPHLYWCFADQPGMHGVALFSKTEPLNVKNGLPADEGDSDNVKSSKEKFSKEGRLITAEFEKFYLINAYVPNSGRADKTEEHPKGYPPKIINGERQKFDDLFRDYIKKLQEKKPVVVTGDLNVAHKEIDLANPKTNERTAGYTKEEREDMTKLLEETKLFDSFRALYPEKKGSYTFWSYMHNARQKNIGWRLDYFLLSEKLRDSLCENLMRTDVYGSDHCPITLFIKV